MTTNLREKMLSVSAETFLEFTLGSARNEKHAEGASAGQICPMAVVHSSLPRTRESAVPSQKALVPNHLNRAIRHPLMAIAAGRTAAARFAREREDWLG